jgi:BlaI family penicillinase repressor
MKLLWQQSPLSALELNEQIKEKKWRKSTVKTLINRLLNKDFISYEKQGRTYNYYPIVKKSIYLAEQNQSFLNELYDGKLTDMMAAFTSQEKLSGDEISEIKKIISNLENKS